MTKLSTHGCACRIRQLDLLNWHAQPRQIPDALLVDCRGVYDALARSSSSCLGLKDKPHETALNVDVAPRQNLVRTSLQIMFHGAVG